MSSIEAYSLTIGNFNNLPAAVALEWALMSSSRFSDLLEPTRFITLIS